MASPASPAAAAAAAATDDAPAAPAPAPTQEQQQDRWPALESSSEVFSELLDKLAQDGDTATTGFSFAEVFSLDPECLAFVPGPCHALVLAYDSDAIQPQGDEEGAATAASATGLVFIKQLPALDAACGTIAMLHAAANTPALRGKIGPASLLARFLASPSASAEAWGQALDGDEELRQAHCACAAQGPTEQVHGEAVQFHYVCLLPDPTDPAKVIELDGLKASPVVHTLGGEEATFLEKAVALVRRFIARFPDPEATAMNVMALVAAEEEEEEEEEEGGEEN